MKNVVCINNQDGLYWLSIGKTYEVLVNEDGKYLTINDQGIHGIYPSKLFTEVEVGKVNNSDTKEDMKQSLVSVINETLVNVRKYVSTGNFKDAQNGMRVAIMAHDMLDKVQ